MQPKLEQSMASGGPLSIAAAVEGAFGASAPPGSTLAGSLLVGAPRYQHRLFLLAGSVKIVLHMGSFLQIFTHAKYEPPSCSAPRSSWPPPERGSVAYEWGLCCHREWMLAAVGSAFFAGCGVGALVGGFLSDRLGRQPVIAYGLAVDASCLMLSALAPNVVVYAVLRFVTGAANIAVILANFTLVMEWAPEGWRSPVSGFLFSCSAIGELSLVPLAAAVADALSLDWRPLTLATGAVSALPLFLVWFGLPESPRWLHACGRSEDAAAVLCRAAKRNTAASRTPQRIAAFAEAACVLSANGLSSSTVEAAPGVAEKAGLVDEAGQSPVATGEGEKHAKGLRVAVRKPSTWVMALLWFTASLTYYGISLAVGEFGHRMGLYAKAGMSASIEIPAAFAAAWLIERRTWGRRLATTMLFAVGGLFCMSLPLVPESIAAWVAIAGKLFLTSAFDGIYVYASEVFETAIRGSAIGLCSLAARVGSVSAPQAIAFLSADQIMLVFGGFALLSAAVCQAVLPETLQLAAVASKAVAAEGGGKYGHVQGSMVPVGFEKDDRRSRSSTSDTGSGDSSSACSASTSGRGIR